MFLTLIHNVLHGTASVRIFIMMSYHRFLKMAPGLYIFVKKQTKNMFLLGGPQMPHCAAVQRRPVRLHHRLRRDHHHRGPLAAQQD